VPKNYEWNADDYARNASVQQKWARELATKLYLQGDETLLDIGCGDGQISAELAAQVPRGWVVGVDSSAAMVDLARGSVQAANCDFFASTHGHWIFLPNSTPFSLMPLCIGS
jgi:trans-aconitate 2-methyltransferase